MKFTRTLIMSAAAIVVMSTAALAEGMGNSGSSAQPSNQTMGTTTQTPDSGAASSMGTAPDSSASVGAATNSQVAMDTDTIQQVQTSLSNAGHSVSVDGVWGPKSAAALREFQQSNNLSVTGQPDAETLAALNVDISR